MTYFGTHYEERGYGLRQSIDELLYQYAANSGILIDQANFLAIEEANLGSLIRYEMPGTFGIECWQLGQHVTRADMEQILDMLAAAIDRVLIDESIYMKLEHVIVEKYLDEFCTEHNLDWSCMREAQDQLGIDEPRVEQDYGSPYAYFDIDDETEQLLITRARELGNTWEQHYESGARHYPENCYYCAQALIGVAS